MQATAHHTWMIAAAVLLLSPATTAAQDGTTAADSAIPEIVVTSQRTEQAIERVPIAVTAFDDSALDRFQIETFNDLQFNTPNVSFAKTNFTTSNFQIRGIGETLVAASSDQGVGIHVNDVPLNSPRLFETEYFDVERIEILRGPQGTLYGRNSTGGAVNMITKRPTEEFEILGEFEYGNYESIRGDTAINIPINDVVAVRLAALYVKRDGYTTNTFTGNDIDGRDSYALRGSVRLTPSDTTDINIMVSYFEEDSTRSRSQKQMCHKDPSGLLGCLPDRLDFDTVNAFATLGGFLVSGAALGPLGLYPAGFDFNTGVVNSPDFREVSLEFEPIYKSDELLITAEIDQEIGENFVLTFVGGYQDTSVFSQTDYNADLGGIFTPPALLAFALPNTFAAFFSNGTLPVSAITPGNSGLIGGNILSSTNRIVTYDQSNSDAEQYTLELRLRSDFDGPFNFLLGGFYLDYDSDFDYYVVSTTLDYFSVVGGGAIVGDGATVPAPYFNSETDKYTLESYAVFGEAYYDITDDLKLTGGLRFTKDKKTIRDRQILYDAFTTFGFVPIGTDPIPDAALNGFRDGFAGDADGNVSFDEVTGRAVLEWTPELSGFDSTLFYGSYSRGYKGGGFNPPFDAALFPDTSQFFDPEIINAFEIGSKLRLANNTVSINTSGFYYDYNGLQVSKIQNRTSFNENIDATIWGIENELVWAPNQNWLFNANASYLDTSIGDSTSVDTRDPTAGSPDATLIKDVNTTANCVINHNGAPDPLTAGLIASQFSDCAALAAGLPAPYTVTDGVPVSLKGNELRQAPDFTINIGAQYTYYFGNGMSLTTRVDYYFQTSMWGRIFNRDPIDKISSFDIWNAQITLNSADEVWYMRLFIQNIENDDSVVGLYVTDASSGLWTNVFTTEPRRYGVILGARF